MGRRWIDATLGFGAEVRTAIADSVSQSGARQASTLHGASLRQSMVLIIRDVLMGGKRPLRSPRSLCRPQQVRESNPPSTVKA